MDDDVYYASDAMQLTEEQAKVVAGVERAGASLSVIGVFLIIITFVMFKRLRTVPNTFILFASIANIGASVASLIGLAGIAAGRDSALCRAQAFLLEMFMQSDPWWSFAMAVNVYMVFFFSANPTTFRRYLWVYCVICFGVPMIPAIVCLYIQNGTRGPVYGDATLWCWIGDSWNSLRIFSYYIPIWVCIFLSALIYIAVGYHVFHQRNQLRNLTLSNQGKDVSTSDVRDSAEKNLTAQPSFYGTVTTEVQVTTDVCDTSMVIMGTSTNGGALTHSSAASSSSSSGAVATAIASSSTSASAAPHLSPWGLPPDDEESSLPPSSAHGMTTTMTGTMTGTTTTAVGSGGSGGSSGFHSVSATVTAGSASLQQQHTSSSKGKGRVQGRRSSGSSTKTLTQLHRRARRAWRHVLVKLRNMDPVKLAYLRTSFVFAISVLVTWTPSSINRVYALIHPQTVSYGLNIASAAVLPLQGVWNAIIYFTTSWNTLREEVRNTCSRSRFLRRLGYGRGGLGGRGRIPILPGGGGASGGGMGSSGRAGRIYPRDETFDGLRGGCRHIHLDSTELEMCPPRAPPRAATMGTVRVQRGGELDC